MKKVLIALAVIIGAAVVYVVVTLKSGAELDEASPLGAESQVGTEDDSLGGEPSPNDSIAAMDEETFSEFMEQVAQMQDVVIEEDQAMPTEASQLLAQGSFMPKFHSVKGEALLITDASDAQIVRFENFDTDNGPSLHIYLAGDLSASDFIDLGKIKATKGNVNYAVPTGIDTEKYRYVLVWCKPFGVLFSYAELSPL